MENAATETLHENCIETKWKLGTQTDRPVMIRGL